MKTKRILSALMSVVMVFVMFSVLSVVSVTTLAPVTTSAASATATTTAIYVGPSTRYENNVPSGIFLPLEKSSKYGDDTIVEITAKVKMLSGTSNKPYVQMMRTATTSKDGAVSASAGSVVFYQGDSNNGTTNGKWQDNNTSRIDSNGIFHCYVRLDSIPDVDNCFYSSVWDGGTEYRKSNISGRSTPIGCGVYIGNAVLNDDMSLYSYNDLSMEFLIKDIHINVTTLSGGSGGSVGMELAPAETTLNTDARYFFVGDSKQGNRPDAKNHPLNGRLDQWNICSPDEDTVRQVTVADDVFTGGTHTYTKHNGTNDEFEYYTCSDFGNDVKFELIGKNCYSRYLDDDVAKKAFIIKSHASESKELTSNQGSSTVANIFIPLNIHKFYSAYNASTCGAADLREDSTAVRFGVSFKARRISGTGQPVVGVAYADGNANGASGSSYKDAEFGAPREYGKDRSYNNGLEKSGSGARSTKQSDWVSSSYDPATGEFTALLSTESGYYKQMSRDGKSAYISIGLAEHLNSSLEALNTDSTFVISDIKFTVYELNNSSTVKFDGANQAPKMCKANCDVDTPYQYTQLWDYNEMIDGKINVGVRHAPLNKYSVDGAIQNVFLIDSNVCNRSGCSLTHHAATDTTLEYWSCGAHSKDYNDEFATEELASVSATKKMIVVRGTGSTVAGAFIPLDTDGWVGDRYFIFKCKMKVFGDGVPIITGYRAGYYGSIGTFYPGGDDERTKQAAKDGVATKWVNYDPETCTYTAAFYMWRADPKSYNQFKYYNSTNGAHTAIMLGNYVPTSGQNPGVTANCFTTGFAFTDPEIYVATNAAAGTYTGSNLCTPVTDKTVDFSKNYKYSNCTQLGGSGEWTDRASNTIMNAPLKTWSRANYSGTESFISVNDVPSGFFSSSSSSRMFKMAGVNTDSSYSKVTSAISQEVFLDQNTEYIFDLDYRSFGGVEPSIRLSLNTGTYSLITPTETTNELGHKRIRFTTPSPSMVYNPITNGGNFMVQLGLSDDASLASSLYIANIQLRKYNSGSPGSNHLFNGDFAFGSLGTADYSNGATQLPFWNTNTGGVTGDGTKKYSHCAIMTTPANFFSDTASPSINASNLAMKVTGGTDNYSFQFEPTLEASQYYKLTFYYNFSDTGTNESACTMPTIQQYSHLTTGSKSTTNIDVSSKVSDGKYMITCQFQAPSNLATSISDNYYHANTRLRFNFGSNANKKTLYIYNVSLRKLSGAGGSEQGVNILANVNPIFDSSVYSSLTSVGATSAVDLSANDQAAMTRDLGNGWFREGGGITASLVKVPADFFTYKTGAQRIEIICHLILADGGATSDGINPIYNPNGDATWGDIKDLVHTKRAAIANGWD